MPHYKAGKQIKLLEFSDIQIKVNKSTQDLSLESLAFFWILYYTGCRKSEAYERLVSDCTLTKTNFILDFHKRKKGSSEVPPLKIPLWFPGMDLVCEQLEKARSKSGRKRKLFEKTVKGIRSTEYKRGNWLFPHVQSRWAQIIVKKILGPKYYPHFLRLNRITEICSDATSNLTRIKSFTGIKTIKVIEDYMGVREKEQDASMDYIAKQIKGK